MGQIFSETKGNGQCTKVQIKNQNLLVCEGHDLHHEGVVAFQKQKMQKVFQQDITSRRQIEQIGTCQAQCEKKQYPNSMMILSKYSSGNNVAECWCAKTEENIGKVEFDKYAQMSVFGGNQIVERAYEVSEFENEQRQKRKYLGSQVKNHLTTLK